MPVRRLPRALFLASTLVFAATIGSLTAWSSVSAAGLKWLDTSGWPAEAVLVDTSGRLYATGNGGASGGGIVIEFTPNAAKTRWTAKVLHNFVRCSNRWTLSHDPKFDPWGLAHGSGVWVPVTERCADGWGPNPGLVMDHSGRIYGTTSLGAAAGKGGVFELTPDRTGTRWTEKLLHSFAATTLSATVMLGPSGRLYATESGALCPECPAAFMYPATGAAGKGAVIELTPNATKTAWTEKTLYTFCSQPFCSDGATPWAALIADASGSLYGTTLGGGAYGNGTVFKLTRDASKTKWTETVLYSFCPSGQFPNCPDGGGPGAPLVMSAGKLYGTTDSGGDAGKGTVFELTPNAATGTWTEKLLYSFCAQPDCRDGSGSGVFIVIDAAGNLYGTTGSGGTAGDGTLFKLTHNQATDSWSEAVLHSFCGSPRRCGGTYYLGTLPSEPPILDASGNLYGGTRNGGGGSPNSRGVWMFEPQPPTR